MWCAREVRLSWADAIRAAGEQGGRLCGSKSRRTLRYHQVYVVELCSGLSVHNIMWNVDPSLEMALHGGRIVSHAGAPMNSERRRGFSGLARCRDKEAWSVERGAWSVKREA